MAASNERVDFVLAYNEGNEKSEKRESYERNLAKEGLKLDQQPHSDSTSGISFLKICVPFRVMCTYAETLELRKPLKPTSKPASKLNSKSPSNRIPVEPETSIKTEFRANIEHEFDIPEDKESFFTSAERAQVIWYILKRIGSDDKEKVGITTLLNEKVYLHAYPLHDGDYDDENQAGVDDGPGGMRAELRKKWANWGKWRYRQPLNDIREYFGDEVALYFAWIGLYTKALIPAAIAGVACFAYGLIQLATPDKKPVDEVCSGAIGNEFLCKRCSSDLCTEEEIKSSCGTRWLLLLFDHPATVVYSIFLSFWATGFLEYWERTQARLCLKWGGESLLSTGGSDRDTWETRPEYEARERRKRYTQSLEKVLRVFTAFSVVVFMVSIVVAALIGIVAYKMAVSSALYFIGDDYVKNNSKNLTTLTAAIINLVIIISLKMVYDRIAGRLTDMENPKTQSDYEASYTFKVFVFEFFNCYSSLFYIAFFKGRFYTYPGDQRVINSFLATDTCDSGGCLAELFIQLIVIMVGKQLLNNFAEILMPRIKNWWSRHRSQKGSEGSYESPQSGLNRWEADYQLQPATDNSLFVEIMEIVLQYGFVTLFAVAFPLAPLCALINNIAEIRLDADKLVTQFRRPLPHRTNTIGPWFAIQQIITYIAVAVNAFLIAFTTEFIPRLVYVTQVSHNYDMSGYVNFTLSVYAKNDTETCRYKGFREPPNSAEPYDFSPMHWQVLTAQLAFVIVYEHVVLGLSGIIAYCIPDIPRAVREQAHHEREYTRAIRRLPQVNAP